LNGDNISLNTALVWRGCLLNHWSWKKTQLRRQNVTRLNNTCQWFHYKKSSRNIWFYKNH